MLVSLIGNKFKANSEFTKLRNLRKFGSLSGQVSSWRNSIFTE